MKVREIECAVIQVREGRQREDMGDLDELRVSIRDRAKSRGGRFQDGLINPITYRKEGKEIILVAGGRRLEAHKLEGAETIFGADWSSLTPDEAELVELEENTRRKDLHWTEQARAIQRIHRLKTASNPNWKVADTGEYLGYARIKNEKTGDSTVVLVNQAIALDGLITPALAKAPSLASAYQTISRTQTRALADISNELFAAPVVKPSVQMPGLPSVNGAGGPNHPVPQAPKPPPVESIHTGDFLTWAPAYSGQKFNFLHCDFPYGIDLDESDQMRHEQERLYKDSAVTYWNLCEALVANIDKLLFPSAHIMFWLSADFDIYSDTMNFFRKHESVTGLRFFPRPLIWHKTDGQGVVPDHRRRPRNTYEIALMASRQDRFIIKPVTSSYGCPIASKRIHPSEKPEPMLKHFFQMFVDENTQFFDPTAGGGSAVRAADDLGAKRVLGLELDPEFAGAANAAIRQARAKRALASAQG